VLGVVPHPLQAGFHPLFVAVQDAPPTTVAVAVANVADPCGRLPQVNFFGLKIHAHGVAPC
ncbi:hypothetical protein ABTK58_20705, partial [Acinetobacter baumannii]